MLVNAFAWSKTMENIWKSWFCSWTWEGLVEKQSKQQNSKWATSFWVSTSFWESLPIADQLTFFFVFLHEPYYIILSHAWWKRYFFHDFQMFFIVPLFWSTYTTALWRLLFGNFLQLILGNSIFWKLKFSGLIFRISFRFLIYCWVWEFLIF